MLQGLVAFGVLFGTSGGFIFWNSRKIFVKILAGHWLLVGF